MKPNPLATPPPVRDDSRFPPGRLEHRPRRRVFAPHPSVSRASHGREQPPADASTPRVGRDRDVAEPSHAGRSFLHEGEPPHESRAAVVDPERRTFGECVDEPPRAEPVGLRERLFADCENVGEVRRASVSDHCEALPRAHARTSPVLWKMGTLWRIA